MKQFIHPERRQMEMKYESVDMLVSPNHEVRGVWAFVEKIDMPELESKYCTLSGEAGRPAIHPRLLLAIWLWGLAKGVVTSRTLEEACRINDEFKWLCGGINVNYHTISDFRSAYPKLVADLLTKGLAVLDDAGLINLERLYIDGTKVDANASTKSFRRRPTLENKLKQAKELLNQLDKMSDDEKEQLSKKQLAAQKRHGQEKIERIERALECLEHRQVARDVTRKCTGEARASFSDPDANRMKRQDNGFRMSHNIQVGVTEGPRPVVVSVHTAKSPTDANELIPMVEDVERRLDGRTPDTVVADNGYFQEENVEYLSNRNIEFVSPDKQADAKQDDPFSGDKFVFRNDRELICPAGETLNYIGKGKDGKRIRYTYRKADCNDCIYKSDCCPKAKGGRTVKLAPKERRELLAKHRANMKTEKADELMALRKQCVELANAQLKGRAGLKELFVRGIEKVTAMASLSGLSHDVMIWTRYHWQPN